MPKTLPRLLAAALALASVSAHADPIAWTDWTSTGASVVMGSLSVDSSSVDVTFSGGYSFAQLGTGINYWTEASPAPYTASALVDNAPTASELIALNAGGSVTITFSQAVHDPLIGLVSWNDNTVDFGVPIEILSYGRGYWGNGTPILNGDGDGFYGSGEVHGVIRLAGDYTSITFTHTGENWHGLTVGVVGLAPVPEAETWALMLAGLGLVGWAARRRG